MYMCHFQQNILVELYYKRCLGQGNIFRSVCQSFCSLGGGEGEEVRGVSV